MSSFSLYHILEVTPIALEFVNISLNSIKKLNKQVKTLCFGIHTVNKYMNI